MMNYALNLSPLYLSVSRNCKAHSTRHRKILLRHNLPFQVHVCSRKATSCFDKFLYSETNVCFWIWTKQLLGSVEILVLSNSTANFSFLFYFEKAKTQASLVNQHAFTSSPIHKALSRLHIPQGNPFPFFYMESNEYLLLIDCGTIQLNGIR